MTCAFSPTGRASTCAVASRVPSCHTRKVSYVKLDTAFLASTTWIDRDARDIMLTAMLMAEIHEVTAPVPQLEVDSLEPTGWAVQPGWYGFVRAAGTALAYRAGVPWPAEGVAALQRLGAPEPESRSQEHDGRRLVRVNGGYILLNYVKYREKDHTTAERSKRYRDKQRAERVTRDTVDNTCDDTPERDAATVPTRVNTHADADADAEILLPPLSDAAAPDRPKAKRRKTETAEVNGTAKRLYDYHEALRVKHGLAHEPREFVGAEDGPRITKLLRHVCARHGCSESIAIERIRQWRLACVLQARDAIRGGDKMAGKYKTWCSGNSAWTTRAWDTTAGGEALHKPDDGGATSAMYQEYVPPAHLAGEA